ncbi:Major facilitator superfamily MFS-1 [Rhodopirellula maiorica SM1]|uniref:Major facilitator superfamily MFS-1 n=1 Tax=Rhodopirellula maiorica SM1 TaxID=1265738 RepID=M5RH61_9BACT|nr:MFS transporter [Rhodopirellula maiorica]EMI18680.1 Major facilitator superfamily MFS-1 [Rhodopirellula maiorica SM1]
MSPSESPPIRPPLTVAMLALVIAGEAIFFLPFVIARVFRPTLLEVFGISNLELGLAFSAYGVTAMLAYFPGGPLADAFAPRKMMTLALLSTSLGGVLLATIPSLGMMKWLYAYWGLTTILLFWAAMIRATREIGGEAFSGTAFGILDGGRGLVAAASGSIAVLIYAWLLPTDPDSATLAQRTDAFEQVILVFAGLTLGSAVLVWFAVRGDENQTAMPHQTAIPHQTMLPRQSEAVEPKITLSGAVAVVKMPTVALQAVIIVCAYVGYKGLDDISLYAREVLGYDEVAAAHTSTVSMWIRPVAAIMAGIIADRSRISSVTALSFLVVALGCSAIALGVFKPGMNVFFFGTIIATSAAVFALRGLYFAIMQEGDVPFHYTGTAVGVVSAIGYTPDVFMGPMMGKLLDDSPGALGHQHLFAMVALFALIGCVASLAFPLLRKAPKRV